MKESVLKKEFSEKDIQRVRNLVKGKEGEKTQTSVGYSKKYIYRNEGEIWEEDGRKWTIKDGIKQNITKLDKAKKSINIPLFCPNCNNIMKKRNDKPFYRIHNKCFDCVIEMEHELKKEGKWEEYQRKIKNDEIDNKIKEFKFYIEEKLKESNQGFISEDGDIEKWVGKLNKKEVNKYISSVVDYLESLKE